MKDTSEFLTFELTLKTGLVEAHKKHKRPLWKQK